MKSTLSWKLLARATILAGLYLALARLGSVTAVATGSISAVGPAAGLALAAVWWGGYRLAPAIGLGAFIFTQLNGTPILAGAGSALANMSEPVVEVFLIR